MHRNEVIDAPAIRIDQADNMAGGRAARYRASQSYLSVKLTTVLDTIK